MKTENIVAVSFFLGGLAGIAIMTWIVFSPLPWWRDDPHFATFSKDCIISDLGAEWQVYAPLHQDFIERVDITPSNLKDTTKLQNEISLLVVCPK